MGNGGVTVDVLYVGGPIVAVVIVVVGAWRWLAYRRNDDMVMTQSWVMEHRAGKKV